MDRGGLTRTVARRAPGAQVTLDERVDMLKDAGVDLQVLCIGAEQPYGGTREEATAITRFANDAYHDIARGYGGRFAAFAAVPLPHVDAAIEEAGRCLDSLGMLGINIGCSVGDRGLEDPAFEPFFAELNRRHAVLFLHPTGTGAGALTNAFGMVYMVGVCFEDTAASIRLIMSGLTTRYPDIQIIVPHLGGTLPFLMQRIDDHMERMVLFGEQVPATPPKEAVRSLHFDTVNCHPPALRCACETFGHDRVMLGTDFPFLAGPKFKRCISYIQESGLPADQVEAILDRNAQRLLGL
jgi:aminocarboxymuconate-semialdehyde decarboxylase